MPKLLRFLVLVCLTSIQVSAVSEVYAAPVYYRRILYSKPVNLDPIMTGEGSDVQVLRQLFDQLVTYDKDFSWKPMLASAWTVSASGRVYTFEIRKGVKFSDGKTMTPEDVLFSLKRAVKEPASRYYADFYKIKGAREYREGKADNIAGLKIINGKLVIESERSNPYLLSMLASPAGSVLSRNYAANTRKEKTPAGTGPFVLKCASDKAVILEANKNYFRGAPALAGIVYYLYANKADIFQDFLARKLDDIAPYNLPAGAERSGLKRVFTNGVITFFAVLNPASPPLDNKHVRRALAVAVDFDALLLKMKEDYPMLPRSMSYIPRGRLGYNAAFSGLKYDPERARRLLREAGYKDFSEIPPIRFQFTGNIPYSKELAEGMLEYYSRVGLRFVPETVSSAKLEENVSAGRWQMAIIGWDSIYTDSYFLLGPFHSGSQAKWLERSDKKLDAILDRSETEMNPARRLDLFRQANELLVNDAHVIPLYSGDMFDGSFQKWVDGVQYPNTAFFDLSMYPVSINPELSGGRPQMEPNCEK